MVLDVMAKTSLVVFVDDPLISQQLGEFLNQVQSGLLQGSAGFGMLAPRASLLISSNSLEVERYHTVIICQSLSICPCLSLSSCMSIYRYVCLSDCLSFCLSLFFRSNNVILSTLMQVIVELMSEY